MTLAEVSEQPEDKSFYDGARIAIPALITVIITAVGWWLTANEAAESKGKLEQRIVQAEATIVEVRLAAKATDSEMIAMKVNMAGLKVDVSNIKEDTEETLMLVRNWTEKHH